MLKNKIIFLSFVMLIFYLWTSTDFVNPFTKHYDKSYYNLFTDSVLEGKLYLKIQAPKELFESEDPYNVAKRKYNNAQINDLSFYKGNLFMYYGISPIIVLYAPFKILTGLDIPDSIACLVFMFGGFLLSANLFFSIKEKYFSNIPDWMFLLCLTVLGVCNVAPFMLRRPPMQYEVAISSSYFFLTGGIYCFIKYLNTPSNRFLFFCGLLFGLAVCSRFSFIAGTLLLMFFLFKEIKAKFLHCLIPFASLIALQLIYNYLRFDSIFETGIKYQLGLIDYTKNTPFSIENVFVNLPIYLTKPVLYSYKFPFIELPTWGPAIVKNIWAFERMAGILTSIPFVNTIFLCALLLLEKDFDTNTLSFFPKKEIMVLSIPTIANFVALLLFHYQTYRYLTDVVTFLIIITSLIWFYTDLKLKKQLNLRNCLRVIVVFLSVISIVFSLAFSLRGYFKGLETQNLYEFKKLEEFFFPVSLLLKKLGV